MWRWLEVVTAVGLYSISTANSVTLFVELAGESPFKRVTFFAMAFVFELSKIALWVEGIKKHRMWFKVLAILFTCASLVASASNILSTLKTGAAMQKQSSFEYDEAQGALEGVKARIASESARLAALDPTYRTTAAAIADRIASLEKERDALVTKVTTLQATSKPVRTTTTVIADLAEKLRLDGERLQLAYLVVLAVLLELGGLTTSAAAISVPVSTVKRLSKSTDLTYMVKNDTIHIVHPAGPEIGKSFCRLTLRGPILRERPQGTLCADCVQNRLMEAKA
jgi:hypothetical protein